MNSNSYQKPTLTVYSIECEQSMLSVSAIPIADPSDMAVRDWSSDVETGDPLDMKIADEF